MLSPPEAVEIIVATMMEFGRSEAVTRWYRAFFTSLFEFAVDHELMGDLHTAFMLWEHEMLPTISEHRHKIALSASKALFCVMKMDEEEEQPLWEKDIDEEMALCGLRK